MRSAHAKVNLWLNVVGRRADGYHLLHSLVAFADLLRGKERYAEAVQAYDTAIQRLRNIEERHWSVFFGRGIVEERLKQWPKAEADMKKALELSPEQPHVLNYLGYSWIDQGLNLDEGDQGIKQVVAIAAATNDLQPEIDLGVRRPHRSARHRCRLSRPAWCRRLFRRRSVCRWPHSARWRSCP